MCIRDSDVSVTYDAKEIAEGAPEGTTVIGTPVPVESDTKPITGVVVRPPTRILKGLYDKRDKSLEELQADRLEFINGIGGVRENFNSLDVLDWLIKNGPRGDYKLLAERFRAQMVKIQKLVDIDFRFMIIQKGTDRLPQHRGGPISKYLGVSHGPVEYNGRQTMQVYINDMKNNVGFKPGVNGVDYNTILHELVHQVTQISVHTGQFGRGDEKTRANYEALENLRARVEHNMERGANKFCSEWKLADTGNNGFVWLGNITDMDGMGAFLSTDEEAKWDKDNGCIYKIYTMSEMTE